MSRPLEHTVTSGVREKVKARRKRRDNLFLIRVEFPTLQRKQGRECQRCPQKYSLKQ